MVKFFYVILDGTVVLRKNKGLVQAIFKANSNTAAPYFFSLSY
jgi:hypothetical protein